MNIMAEEIDEVMNLLEVEPAAACQHLDPTFLLFARSLRFWFLLANAKTQSA